MSCDDSKEALNQIYIFSGKLNQMCESVQYGSSSDFLLFYEEMQYLENAVYGVSDSPEGISERAWKLIDTAKIECPQLKTQSNNAQLQFSLMGLCFESIYEEFGQFPAMWLGMSPDYFEYNPAYTENNNQCVLFCDSYGYEPYWPNHLGFTKQLQDAPQS